MIQIKKDPLSIATSLIFNLNLLEENKEYNINEIKSLRNLEQHWVTIQKYLKIFCLIQKYSPKIELNESKLKISQSKIYSRLNEKEKLIIYLFNNEAINKDNAAPFPDNLQYSAISESLGYLFERTESDNFYLTKGGLNVYRSIKQSLIDLIFNEKDIDEIFGEVESQSSIGFENFRIHSITKEENLYIWIKLAMRYWATINLKTEGSIFKSLLLTSEDDMTNPKTEVFIY